MIVFSKINKIMKIKKLFLEIFMVLTKNYIFNNKLNRVTNN